jgi:class 3 adenylate cyclase
VAEPGASNEESASPAGFGSTVTVLFTDIRGFTEFTDGHGDEAAYRMLQHHNTLVQEQIAAHGGRVVKTLGDSFMVSFDAVRTAVACAAAIQTAVDRYNAAQGGPRISVGIGINTGEPVREGGDLFGGAVNLASRICAAAGPGEILISETARRVAGKIEGVEYVDRAFVQLKGFQEAQHLFGVDWSGRGDQAGVGPARAAPPGAEAPLGSPGRTRGRVRLLVAAGAVALVGVLAGTALVVRGPGVGAPRPEGAGPAGPNPAEVMGEERLRSPARFTLSDDFSDPARGLFLNNQRGVARGVLADDTSYEYQWEYRYADGALVARLTLPAIEEVLRPYKGAAAADRVFGDFAVEVRARTTTSGNRARYGIEYVLTDEDRYRLEVAPAVQQYGLSLGPLQRNLLAHARSSAVNREDAENHLRMEVRGGTMTAFVNGIEVDQGEHPGLARRGGTVELIVGHYQRPQEAPVEVRFTDFRLFSLD